ncbi:MAG: hypothetical protein WED33_01970 [Bacteroidia bacterium]
MNNLKYLLFALSIIFMLCLAACKKEENLPPPSPPVIAILSISADTITEFQDSLIIKLQYEDQNGDLGSENPDKLDLEIKDSRLTTPDFYHVKPLAPAGTALFIRGVLRVELPPLFILGNGDSETLSLDIRLRDQNGKWSELVSSDPLVVIRQ